MGGIDSIITAVRFLCGQNGMAVKSSYLPRAVCMAGLQSLNADLGSALRPLRCASEALQSARPWLPAPPSLSPDLPRSPGLPRVI